MIPVLEGCQETVSYSTTFSGCHCVMSKKRILQY